MTAHKNAFTLIEILIVIAILGILSAIAASAFQNAQVTRKENQTSSR